MSNPGLDKLNGRMIYLLSCLTAQQLGPAMIDAGAISYAGFKDEWTWAGNDPNGDPYDDPYARCFYESANELWLALIDGYSFGEAVEHSKNKYDWWIDYWLNSTDISASTMVGILSTDKDLLVPLGDQTAHLLEDPCMQRTTSNDCIVNGCYWWPDGTCHGTPYVAPSEVGGAPGGMIQDVVKYVAGFSLIGFMFYLSLTGENKKLERKGA